MRVPKLLALVVGLTLFAASAAATPGGDSKTPPEKSAGEKPGDGKAEREKWAEHMGDVPFVIGYEKGLKDVEYTGKPPMLFFTATW